MPSPSRSRATKRRRSSIAEHAFHGINTPRQKAKSVTYVSGTNCHLCLGSLNKLKTSTFRAGAPIAVIALKPGKVEETLGLLQGIPHGVRNWAGL